MANPDMVSEALDLLSLSSMSQTVLGHPNIWKINFQINNLLVVGQRYASVAKAIETGAISVETVKKFDPPPGKPYSPGTITEARYLPDKNKMQFPRGDYGTTAYEKTVILHEATHAMFDLYAKSDFDAVLAIDDEAAAVLAQAFYIRFCGAEEAEGKFKFIGNGPGDLGLKLVDKAIAQTKRFNFTGTYVFQSDPALAAFREAVAWKWELFKKGDVDSSGALDIYDGVKCSRCWSGGDQFNPYEGGKSAGSSLRSGTQIN